MIEIKSKADCCGCNACGDICPTDAIAFKTDIEGFWYPEVNLDKCINCHLCEKTCPNLNIQSLKHNDWPEPKETIAAVNTNMRERFDSTSGGAYSVFADAILAEGGFVSGAVYNDNFMVENYVTDNVEDMPRLRSSKYLESNAEGLYKKIEQVLKSGKKVLACGTPCQMAALRAYLRKDYENLIIVDFICRGVNSPKVYRKYLDSLERKFGSKIVAIKAKNKDLGWRNLTRKVTFANGNVYYGVLMEDDFRRGYHTNVYCRPSCYTCVFKGFPRMADITIGDCWGIERIAPNLDNNLGTSLVMLNSQKGVDFFNSVKDHFEAIDFPFDIALRGNPAFLTPLYSPLIDRKEFFEDLDQHDFEYVVKKHFPKKNVNRTSTKAKLKRRVGKLKALYHAMGVAPSGYWKTIKVYRRKNTFCKSGKKLYIHSGVTLDISPKAKIFISNDFHFGVAPVKGMKMPTCLKMTSGSELHLLPGQRDRYGSETAAYSLKYGAYIEIINGGRLTFHTGAANVGLTIMCADEVTIGAGVRIGRNVSIRDWNGPHVIVTPSYRNSAPVHIGERVWLASGVCIMPGVTIGEGSVIGANSVVTRDIPPHSLAVGSPARVIKSDIEWY